MVKVHPVKYGKTTRQSFSKIEEVLDMPNLIAIQKDSYREFCERGLMEVLRDISPIETNDAKLDFDGYTIADETNYSIEECKEREATYSSKLKFNVRLTDKRTGVVKEEPVFIGEFPRMTDNGTFILNGAERVIVSQLVRSPGAYFEKTVDKIKNKETIGMTLIPNRGVWLECETDGTEFIQARIDRNRKIYVTTLLRALGYSSDEDIIKLFSISSVENATPEVIAEEVFDSRIRSTIKKEFDSCKVLIDKVTKEVQDTETAITYIYGKLRPGEQINLENAKSYIFGMFFDPKRYDLAKVGRYKYNKKLSLAARLKNQVTVFDIISPLTGEVLAEAGQKIDETLAFAIQDAGINEVAIKTKDTPIKIMGNNTVDMKDYVSFDPAEIGIKNRVHYTALKNILEDVKDLDVETQKKRFKDRIDELLPKCLTKDDIIASINYIVNLKHDIGSLDDIDHLGNRRIRAVGELLQIDIRKGLAKLEHAVKERMGSSDSSELSPSSLVNPRPITSALRDFFGSSQLSQFMDQTNPLAELANKRRLSALGPGGLNRDRATFEVRDVHYTHYGRMCPIETPEGSNIGLIGSLSTYARVNEYGFIEAPYRRVENGVVTNVIDYLPADEEDRYIVAQANEPLDKEGHFINSKVVCRSKDEFVQVEGTRVNYMDVSPKQVVSVGAAMIPFLEHDDASRALMGCNMQRQAVPLLVSEAPIVATGIEYKAAVDSGSVVLANTDGIVSDVTSKCIKIRRPDGIEDEYHLLKFLKSNQSTCVNQKPIVKFGEAVKAGQVIADGPSTDNGEIALGRNILIGFMTWEGYNYEDAVLISEKIVKQDIFTSIHIEVHEIEARDTKLGEETITRDVPNVGDDALKNIGADGVIAIGSEVRSGDILVGKTTPKGEKDISAEEKLLRAIFGDNITEVRDTSLKVPHGQGGVVVDVKKFNKENCKELNNGVNELIRVYVAQKRKLSVGDKMAGRHGNKGVVSRVLPEEDMPYLPDGRPLEIVLNPLGVPSRMNIGQVLEVHLGHAAKLLGWKIATPVFDGASEQDILDTLDEAGLPADGKIQLYDGRTGQPFDNKVTVGYMYYLKLHHLVDDKIHARSIGPYSLVTQQPLGGKAQFGGQRFGEMEVWALEAYGAAYTLQEILTIKSDDTFGRVKTHEAIVKGDNVPEAGLPESFKVLVKELQSLVLDVKIFDSEGKQIPLKQAEEEYIKNPDKYRSNLKNDEMDDFIAESVSDNGDISSGEIENLRQQDDVLIENIDSVSNVID